MKKIISASRRTDVIANNYDNLIKTLKAESTTLQNPFFKNKKYTIDLSKNEVHTIVLWSKDFTNFVKNPSILMEYNLAFQYTINDYPEYIEKAPKLETTMINLKWLIDNFSFKKIIIRFDPVFFQKLNNDIEDAMEERLTAFENIIKKIEEITDEKGIIITSYIDLNKRVKNQLLSKNIKLHNPTDLELEYFFKKLKKIADDHGFTIYSCADPRLKNSNIEVLGCINGKIIDKNEKFSKTKDNSQRKNCRCIKSYDIGVYPYLDGGKPCKIQCAYCYVKGNIPVNN